MKVEIWSDVVCPWCYIGKRRFEAALARFEHAGDVEVVWRSFELDPGAPAVRDIPNVERLARKYGVSIDQAQAMLDRMTTVAEGEDLHFRLDIARSGNTFDAHRLLHLALGRVEQAILERAVGAERELVVAAPSADGRSGVTPARGLQRRQPVGRRGLGRRRGRRFGARGRSAAACGQDQREEKCETQGHDDLS